MGASGRRFAIIHRAAALISLFLALSPYIALSSSPTRPWQSTAQPAARRNGARNGSNSSSHAATPVILISVDTLGASHLSAYGYRRAQTPHIDSFARGGTLFSAVSAQIPLTLPSHTVLFTSTYPFVNGMRENQGRLPAGTLTLAAYLRRQGYHTAAFIGGYFLARQFGLDQGFEVYDSPFYPHLQSMARAADLKRNAATVLDSAAPWVSAHRQERFFLFIHLFDLHRPYSLPAAAADRNAAAGYDAEIGYVDRNLAGFIQLLKRQGLWDRALVVFTSDHGESLGAHGENTHGYFVYQSTLWVPLIIHWPAGFQAEPSRVNAPMGLIDVAPTLLKALGMPVPAAFEGHALASVIPDRKFADARTLLQAGASAPAALAKAATFSGPPITAGAANAAAAGVYSESDYPRDHFGCAPLRALRLGAYKLIDTPRAELYNLQTDPGETHNLIQQMPAVAEKLHQREMDLLGGFKSKPAAAHQPTPRELALLGSLGYLAGVRANSGVAGTAAEPDAKDRLSEYLSLIRALRLGQTGRLSQAIPMFRQIIAEDPGNAQAHYDLAECYLGAFNPRLGFAELHRALEVAPGYMPAEEALGEEWLARGQYERAGRRFREVLAGDPADFVAAYNLGFILYHQGRFAESRPYFQTALTGSPHSAHVLNSLGLVDMRLRAWRRSETELRAALRLQPNLALAHYNLARLLADEGQRQTAALEFKTAARLDPSLRSAAAGLYPLPQNSGGQIARH
jgi:choline-sulfatase